MDKDKKMMCQLDEISGALVAQGVLTETPAGKAKRQKNPVYNENRGEAAIYSGKYGNSKDMYVATDTVHHGLEKEGKIKNSKCTDGPGV